MMLQRLILSLALLSAGLYLPTVTYAVEINDVSKPSDAADASVDSLLQLSPSPRLNLEERLVSAGDEFVEYEHTFIGYENEMIVVHWEEASDFAFAATVLLYNSANERVRTTYYPDDISVAEFAGRSLAFRLSATDEYRLVFSSADAVRAYDSSVLDLDFTMSVRVASFYERAMIHAINMLENERYDEALTGFSLAAEQASEEPMPYVGRLLVTGLVAIEASGLTEDEVFTTAGLSQLYQLLTPEVKARVLADLQQSSKNFGIAVENGVIAADEFDLDVALFEDVAAYLETGVASSTLLELLE